MPADIAEIPKSVRFHYLKSSQFRVILAEGAIGGITPNGMVHMALFNERAAIPREMVHSVNADGTLGTETAREGKEGVVREMEVDVMLSPTSARLLHTWLGEQIRKLEQRGPVN